MTALDLIFGFVIWTAPVAVLGLIALEMGARFRSRTDLRRRGRLEVERQRAIDWAEYLGVDAQTHSARQWSRYEMQSEYYDNRFRNPMNGAAVVQSASSE